MDMLTTLEFGKSGNDFYQQDWKTCNYEIGPKCLNDLCNTVDWHTINVVNEAFRFMV